MDLGCGCEDGDGKVERRGSVGGENELCDEGEKSGRGCANLEDEFAEAGDVDLRDVE